jgi:uncharacterized coiled-coil protein SlyX
MSFAKADKGSKKEEESEYSDEEDPYMEQIHKQDEKIEELQEKIVKLNKQIEITSKKIDLVSNRILKLSESSKYDNNQKQKIETIKDDEEESEDEPSEDALMDEINSQNKNIKELGNDIDKLKHHYDILQSKFMNLPSVNSSSEGSSTISNQKNKTKTEEKIEEKYTSKGYKVDQYMNEIYSQNEKIKGLNRVFNKIQDQYDVLQSKFMYLTYKTIQVPETIKTGKSFIIPKIDFNIQNLQIVFTIKLIGDTPLAEYAQIDDGNLIYINIKLKKHKDESDKYLIYLEYFKSLIGIDSFARNLATKAELDFSKGLAHRSFCRVINYISNYISTNKEIVIKLSGNVELEAVPGIAKFRGDDPHKLIKYYEYIGFEKKDSSSEGCKPETNEVRCKMKSTIPTILKKCEVIPANDMILIIELTKEYPIK